MPSACPPGFTITTEACVAYMEAGGELPDGLEEQVDEALGRLEDQAGKKLGDADRTRCSYRSARARASRCPGCSTRSSTSVSTTSRSRASAGDRFAWDSYRRFVQMFGNVCRGIAGERFEELIEERKREAGVKEDTELSVDDLKALTEAFKDAYEDEFPQEPREQLIEAIRAVFDSWTGRRAVEYRRINRIPDTWGTAVNVQQMVFGNRGDKSCSGVAFSRDEITGAPEPSGDFLVNAQGEDVVSGVRTPLDISEMKELMPDAHERADGDPAHAREPLQGHAGHGVHRGGGDPLHAPDAQREAAAQAAVRFAVDAVEEGLLDKVEAMLTIDAERLDALLHPAFARDADFEVLTKGVAASPGAATGAIVLHRRRRRRRGRGGPRRDPRAARSPRRTTWRASTRPRASSRARAARRATPRSWRAGWASPAWRGAGELEIDLHAKKLRVGDTELSEGDRIAIDGSTGVVTADDVPLEEPEVSDATSRRCWAGRTSCAPSACAPTPTRPRTRRRRASSAPRASACAARSTSSWAPTARPMMQAMIMAESDEERGAALDQLLELQHEHFKELFDAMRGLPVTIRLLDPPLHEFIPNAEELAQEVERARIEESDDLEELERTLERVHDAGGDQPDARHARRAARHPPPRDLRDAGARDRARARRRDRRADPSSR